MDKIDILQGLSVTISKYIKSNLSDIKKLDKSDRKDIEEFIKDFKTKIDNAGAWT